MARKKRRKKKGMAGFWVLESIVVIAFAGLLMNARTIREATAESADEQNDQVSMVDPQVEDIDSAGWENHRPRFSQVIGDLFNGGF